MNPAAEALAWALVHFIWQGAALALIAFFAIRWLRLQAEGRYVAGILTLAAMLASPVITYAVLARTPAAAPTSTVASDVTPDVRAVSADPAAPARTSDIQARPAVRATTLLLAAWLFGVGVLSMRLAGGWVVARRMVTRRVRPVTPDIALLARRVAARLALDRAVRVIESSAVSVPVMVGWLKPVVLLPAVAVSGLTTTQLEALIAHELAHVRRHDYLVNLLQAAVETLLFYHPAVWWVSRQVRAEREHCCDDLAVGICDRLVYVSALSDLAAMTVPKTVLAATGGSLLARVKRILGAGDPAASTGGAWIPTLVGLVVLGAVVPAFGSEPSTGNAAAAPQAGQVAVIEEAGAVTLAPKPVPAGDDTTQLTVLPPMEPIEAFPAEAQAADQGQLEREIQVLLEKLRELDKGEKVSTDLRQFEIEQARTQLDMRQHAEASQIELAELRKQRDRMQQLVERNLMNKSELEKIEQRIKEAEMRMQHVREDMDLRLKELANAQHELAAQHGVQQHLREAELARVYEALAQARSRDARDQSRPEVERQFREYQEAIERYKAVLDRTQNAEREARARAVRGRAEFGPTREARLRENTVPVTSANEPIRAGDVLSVEIAGESDLPSLYSVQGDGTVRLPILGSIKVAGLTARQAGQAISKQVSRVNSSASVQVSLRRPRTEERRQR